MRDKLPAGPRHPPSSQQNLALKPAKLAQDLPRYRVLDRR